MLARLASQPSLLLSTSVHRRLLSTSVHRKINLADAFKRISEPWSPHVAGDVNECQIKLAKMKGDFVWHHHEKEDEVCQLVSIHRSLGRRLPAASLPAVLAHPRGRWIETACRSAF